MPWQGGAIRPGCLHLVVIEVQDGFALAREEWSAEAAGEYSAVRITPPTHTHTLPSPSLSTRIYAPAHTTPPYTRLPRAVDCRAGLDL